LRGDIDECQGDVVAVVTQRRWAALARAFCGGLSQLDDLLQGILNGHSWVLGKVLDKRGLVYPVHLGDVPVVRVAKQSGKVGVRELHLILGVGRVSLVDWTARANQPT
jgi:hypothetical protein